MKEPNILILSQFLDSKEIVELKKISHSAFFDLSESTKIMSLRKRLQEIRIRMLRILMKIGSAQEEIVQHLSLLGMFLIFSKIFLK